MTYDLLIRSAQLRGSPTLTDIGILGGRIATIAPGLDGKGAQVIDAEGRLVVPGFVDSHVHIGKSFYGRETGRWDYAATEWAPEGLQERYRRRSKSAMADYEMRAENVVPILKTWAWKEAYTVEDVARRIGDVLTLALANGVTASRMFIDVDSFAGLVELEGAFEAKRRFEGMMRLQICAFPQEGLDADPETARLMRQAMEMGVDVVGGLPWIEWTDELCRRHIDFVFELAREFDKPLHFLCDDAKSPMARTLEQVAAKTLQTGWYGRVASSHNGALSSYPDAHAYKVMNLVRNAEMNISCNSQVNLLGAITRVHELVDLGVNVSIGQDDVDNFYYPFGRCDPLEWAWSMAHAGSFAYPRGIEQVFDMITVNGARTLGLADYGLEEGKRADLVVLDCRHPHDAIQFQVDRRHVISGGRRVAGTTRETWVASPDA
ncbi:MAG: amidohydrolase family protein [Chloroflexota bacterium]